tara:strand:+ start:2232 stop:3881 length:1650 start_codon:yes stop_codon:yes gene_type:complete
MSISNLKKFLGTEIISLFVKILVLGVFIFFVESSSVYVIQGVLLALGLMTESNSMFIPTWYPADISSNISILLGFGFFRFVFTTALTYYTGIVPEVFKLIQRRRIVSYSLNLENEKSFAQFYSLFTESAERAGNALMTIFSGAVNLLLGVLILAYSFSIAWREVLVGIFLLAFLFIPLKILSKRIRLSGDKIINNWNHINTDFGNSIKNRFLINIYNLTNKIKNSLDLKMVDYNKNFFTYRFATAFQTNLTNFIGLLVFSVVCFMGRKYFGTDASILIAVFYLLIRSIQYLNAPINSYSTFQFSKGFFRSLYEVWENNSKNKDSKALNLDTDFNTDKITISASKLSYRYPGTAKDVFSDLSFTVTKGETLLVMGPSGSGKSTLLKLLLGMCEGQGTLTINDCSPQRVSRRMYDHIAYVGPEPYLFQASILENLTFGHPNPKAITETAIKDVLRNVGLLADVEDRGGLSVVINELDGFSTGQKQRFSIARALLRNPSLLILDECTANLDEDIERTIVDIFKSVSEDITTVVISHRPIFKKQATVLITLPG